VVAGLLVILLVYALLPESLRFSRAMILFGGLCILVSALIVRLILSALFPDRFSLLFSKRKRRIVMVGRLDEADRVHRLIGQSQVFPELVGVVDPVENRVSPGYLGHIGQIGDIVKLNKADELIFCGGDLTSRQIITTMMKFTDTGLSFKIAPAEGQSVIGSDTRSDSGELYVLHYNTLSGKLSRRKKRLFDIALSLIFFVTSPVLLWFVAGKAGFFRNLALVLAGLRSWVGYYQSRGGEHPGLPVIRPGILTTAEGMLHEPGDSGMAEKINLNYAKDYRVMNDLQIILRSFRFLGKSG
jgi:O-antigen biosynthesis protein